MNPFAAYYAVNTKVHAKKRFLLSDKEWKKLAEYQDVKQITEFLKKKENYRSLIERIKTDELRRTDLEVILDYYVAEEIEDLLHYFSGAYKEFFKTFLMEYDILDIELIIRRISRNESLEDVERFFTHSKKYGLDIYNKLTSCKNVMQCVETLKGTPYYEALKTMSDEDVTKREFHMEMKLYIMLYKLLLERADKLESQDRKIAHELIGTKVDFINAQWIYRAAKYYHISPEEMLIYSLPGGYKLNYSRLKELSYARSIKELKEKSEKYLGYNLFKDDQDVFIDQRTDKYLYDFAVRRLTDEENIAAPIAYLLLLGVEVNDMIALTECIRYALPQDELKKYLVHTI